MSTLTILRTMREYERPERWLPTGDLKAELEVARWQALDYTPGSDDREFAEMRVADLARELDRRTGLARRNAADPVNPGIPTDDPGLRDRVIRVKTTWPLEEACRQLLGVIPHPTGSGRSVIPCPLGTHDDSTPSFVLYPDGHAHCFGCKWTGDVIALVGAIYGYDRFYDKLRFLEGVAA